MEWQLPAGGWSPQPHVHPHLTEDYDVLDGSARAADRTAHGAACAPAIAPRSPPAPSTPSASDPQPAARSQRAPPARATSSPTSSAFAPPRTQRDLGDLSSLRALLYIAMLVDEFPEHSRAAGRLLNAVAPHLAALARLLRLRPA